MLTRRSCAALYFAVLSIITIGALRQPHCNWDIVPYVASALSYSNSDPATLNHRTFDAVRGCRHFEELTGVSSDDLSPPEQRFRQVVFADPDLLPQQLNFYTVKPLYILILYLLGRICGDFVIASILISALAYGGVSIIAWFWLKPYLTPGVHLLASLLIVITPALIDLARLSTPDSLSTFLTLLGLYLMAERRQYFWGSLVFLVDLAVRPDTLVVAGTIWLVLIFADSQHRQWYAGAGIMGFITVLLIKHHFHAYTWPILFHNSFINRIPNPRAVSIHITPAAYLNVVVTNLGIYLKNSGITVYFFMGMIAFWLQREGLLKHFTLAVLLARIAHFALYPSIETRFSGVTIAFIPISLLIAIGHVLQSRNKSQASVAS